MVPRRTLPPPAGTTAYELTPLGLELEETVHALVRFGGNFMRQRSDAQVFQTHWLPLALRAVMSTDAGGGPPLVVDMNLPEGALRLRFHGNDVETVTEDCDPHLRLDGRAELVLGLASGALDFEAATQAGLRLTGSPKRVDALRRLLSRNNTTSEQR